MMCLSDDKQADIIDALNITSRYLDDILNINNVYFDNMVSQIYPSELQLCHGRIFQMTLRRNDLFKRISWDRVVDFTCFITLRRTGLHTWPVDFQISMNKDIHALLYCYYIIRFVRESKRYCKRRHIELHRR